MALFGKRSSKTEREIKKAIKAEQAAIAAQHKRWLGLVLSERPYLSGTPPKEYHFDQNKLNLLKDYAPERMRDTCLKYPGVFLAEMLFQGDTGKIQAVLDTGIDMTREILPEEKNGKLLTLSALTSSKYAGYNLERSAKTLDWLVKEHGVNICYAGNVNLRLSGNMFFYAGLEGALPLLKHLEKKYPESLYGLSLPSLHDADTPLNIAIGLLHFDTAKHILKILRDCPNKKLRECVGDDIQGYPTLTKQYSINALGSAICNLVDGSMNKFFVGKNNHCKEASDIMSGLIDFILYLMGETKEGREDGMAFEPFERVNGCLAPIEVLFEPFLGIPGKDKDKFSKGTVKAFSRFFRRSGKRDQDTMQDALVAGKMTEYWEKMEVLHGILVEKATRHIEDNPYDRALADRFLKVCRQREDISTILTPTILLSSATSSTNSG